jgi:hypothetical protein
LLENGDPGKREHWPDDMVDGLIVRWHGEAEIGQSIASMEDDGAISRDEHGCADDTLAGDDAAYDRIETGGGHLGDGSVGRADNQDESEQKRALRHGPRYAGTCSVAITFLPWP